MVRKHRKPWDQVRRHDPDDERVRKVKREMEEILDKEQEQAIRGDVDPEIKR